MWESCIKHFVSVRLNGDNEEEGEDKEGPISQANILVVSKQETPKQKSNLTVVQCADKI